jgi:hypothetical protein
VIFLAAVAADKVFVVVFVIPLRKPCFFVYFLVAVQALHALSDKLMKQDKASFLFIKSLCFLCRKNVA